MLSFSVIALYCFLWISLSSFNKPSKSLIAPRWQVSALPFFDTRTIVGVCDTSTA